MTHRAFTDTGLAREKNEDTCATLTLKEGATLLLLADGMGGAAAGDVASRMFIDECQALFRERAGSLERENAVGLVEEAFRLGNRAVHGYSREKGLTGMGTTGVIALIIKNELFGGWIGDSRLYLHRQGRLTQLSRDHSRVQEMVDQGVIHESEAFGHPMSHILSRVIGPYGEVESDLVKPVLLEKEDLILLSSDGLHDLLPDGEIEETLNRYMDEENLIFDYENIWNDLLEQVFERGARDNVSVVLYGHGSKRFTS